MELSSKSAFGCDNVRKSLKSMMSMRKHLEAESLYKEQLTCATQNMQLPTRLKVKVRKETGRYKLKHVDQLI